MSHLVEQLAAVGIAHVGVVARARVDAEAPAGHRLSELAPGAASLLVAASAGNSFWNAFAAHVALNAGWAERRDPLDDFTRLVVDRALQDDPTVVRVFYPFFSFEPRLPFQRLGVLAGLGHPSPLGLLAHPVHGPWFGFRAAIALSTAVAPEAAPIPRVCDTCADKPCITACPAHAVTVSGWDAVRCQNECRRPASRCATTCDARRACPVGRASMYQDDVMTYHHVRGFVCHLPVL